MTIVFNSGTGRLVTWESRDRKFGQLSICLPLSMIFTIQARETPMNTITAHQSAVKAVSWCPWQNNVLATAGQTSFTLGTLVVNLDGQVEPWIEQWGSGTQRAWRSCKASTLVVRWCCHLVQNPLKNYIALPAGFLDRLEQRVQGDDHGARIFA